MSVFFSPKRECCLTRTNFGLKGIKTSTSFKHVLPCFVSLDDRLHGRGRGFRQSILITFAEPTAACKGAWYLHKLPGRELVDVTAVTPLELAEHVKKRRFNHDG